MNEMKNIYFISDAHLGSRAIPHARMQERRLICWAICSTSGMSSRQ